MLSKIFVIFNFFNFTETVFVNKNEMGVNSKSKIWQHMLTIESLMLIVSSLSVCIEVGFRRLHTENENTNQKLILRNIRTTLLMNNNDMKRSHILMNWLQKGNCRHFINGLSRLPPRCALSRFEIWKLPPIPTGYISSDLDKLLQWPWQRWGARYLVSTKVFSLKGLTVSTLCACAQKAIQDSEKKCSALIG